MQGEGGSNQGWRWEVSNIKGGSDEHMGRLFQGDVKPGRRQRLA